MELKPTLNNPAIVACGVAAVRKASNVGCTKTKLAMAVGSDPATHLNAAFLDDIGMPRHALSIG